MIGRGRRWLLVAVLGGVLTLLLACQSIGLASGATSPAVASNQPAATVRQSESSAPAIALRELPYRFEQPLFLTHAGDGSGRMFVVEKTGRIRIVKDGKVLPTPFLDLSRQVTGGSEQGLLGLAFHPRYRENGRFFVAYTDRQGDDIVARYQVTADADVADASSSREILHIKDPASNHNGGMLVFGPDGYLWVGTGDGGGAGDQYQNAQNTQALLGKMLRLDVDAGDPYAIPPDNPFVGRSDVRPEIWFIGMRNPWRYSFDRATGDLWIGDVGQNAYEEIDMAPAGTPGGQNYGWPMLEGRHCYRPASGCDASSTVLPLAEYGRDGGCSVTGGYVYRGPTYPGLQGVYVFGDYCSGRIWTLDQPEGGAWRMVEALHEPLQISSFGEDEAGEVYVTTLSGDRQGHRVFQVVAP